MVNIYSVEEAKQTILNRRSLNQIEYSPNTMERTEAYFGTGVTPPQAVEMIIRSVEEQGDQAIRKWTVLLDQYEGEEIAVSEMELEQAWDMLPVDIQQAMKFAANRIRRFHEMQQIGRVFLVIECVKHFVECFHCA